MLCSHAFTLALKHLLTHELHIHVHCTKQVTSCCDGSDYDQGQPIITGSPFHCNFAVLQAHISVDISGTTRYSTYCICDNYYTIILYEASICVIKSPIQQ